MKKIQSILCLLFVMLAITGCSSNSKEKAEIESKTYNPANTPTISDFSEVSPEQSSVEIEITLENWEEYFEIRENGRWVEDAFGEIDYLWLSQNIYLRDSYTAKVDFSRSSEVAFKADATCRLVDIDYDEETREYWFTDQEWDEPSQRENTAAFYANELEYNQEYGAELFSCGEGYYTIDGVKVKNVEVFQNINVTRVQGYIYLLAEN